MAVYVILLIIEIIGLVAIPYSRTSNSVKVAVLKFQTLILFVFAALRSNTVGGDLERYLPEFKDVSRITISELVVDGYGNRERIFSIIEKLISYISDSDRCFIFFMSLIIIWISYRAIIKHSYHYMLSSFLFLTIIYCNSLNIIRASITVSIALYMYGSIVNRNLLKFLLLLTVAVLIQRTSIVLLPLYFLYNREIKVKFLAVAILGSLAFSFVLTGTGLANVLETYFLVNTADGTDLYIVEKSSGLSNMAIFLLGLTIYVLYCLYKNNQLYKDKIFIFFVNTLVVATCLQFFSSIFTLINRLSLFYYSYLIFALPYFFTKYKESFPLSIRIVVISIFIAIYISGLMSDVQGIVPYKIL